MIESIKIISSSFFFNCMIIRGSKGLYEWIPPVRIFPELHFISATKKFDCFEWVNSGLTSHQQRGHTETGPRFKVSSERPEKRSCDPWIGSLACYPLHHRRSFRLFDKLTLAYGIFTFTINSYKSNQFGPNSINSPPLCTIVSVHTFRNIMYD